MNEQKNKFIGRNVDRLGNLLLCPVLLFVCTVVMATPMPQNVRMDAVNDRYVLKWEWDTMQTGSSSRFTADYSLSTRSDYTVVCNQTTEHHCDYTPMNLNYMARYLLRVRAEGPAGISNWSQYYFSPDTDALLGPPTQVDIISEISSLRVLFTEPLTTQNKSMTSILKKIFFNVSYWEEQAPKQVHRKEFKHPIAWLSPLKPWTMYCLQVCAVSNEFQKTSPLTATQCALTQGHRHLWLVFLIVIICVLLLTALLYRYHREIKELCSGYYIPMSLQDRHLPPLPILRLSDESCGTLDSVETVSLCRPEEESQESHFLIRQQSGGKDSGISSMAST